MSELSPKRRPLISSCSITQLSTYKIYLNLINCTFQTVLGYVCLDLCIAISLHYVAKYGGAVNNAGYGFAYTCMNILIVPFGFGFNQSLNIHAAQALGDQKSGLAKKYLTLNCYILFLTLLPLCGILYALKYPLKFTIAEDREETSDAAWVFLLYFLPASILAMEFEGVKTYLIAYKITYPFTFIHVFTTLTHWFFTWLFLEVLKTGIQGAGIAMVITEILNLVGLALFITFSKHLKKTAFSDIQWVMPLKKFKKLGKSYLKTSAPIVVHLYSEFFVFFLLSFISLSLGTDAMNAHMGVQNTCGIIFRFAISLSLALMSYVGSEMGKSNIQLAKQYTIHGIVVYIFSEIVFLALLYGFKDWWASFYSANETVKQLLYDLFPWMVFGIILINGFQGSINGALKGINKINLVTYSTLIAYYIICIPLVLYFSYDWGLGLGVVGVWQGFGLSNVLLSILFLVALIFTDWAKESKAIVNRIEKNNQLQKSTIVEIMEKL